MREALNQAIREELARDEQCFLMGEEVAEYDGAYKVTKGLLESLAPSELSTRQSPNSDSPDWVSAQRWLACRPIVEFMTFNFSILATDQIINSAAKMLYMSGGQFKIPDRISRTERFSISGLIATLPGTRIVVRILPGTEGRHAFDAG